MRACTRRPSRRPPAVQRRYLAAAVGRRFPGFADVEYPDWRSFLLRLAREAAGSGWPGPFVLDELPYLIASDATLTGALQAWVDTTPGRPTLVVSGSSQRMVHGRRPGLRRSTLRPSPGGVRRAPAQAGLPRGPVSRRRPGASPCVPCLVGRDAALLGARRAVRSRHREGAVDTLVLDPAGPLHPEPDRLLLEETPPATSLRPLLDVIGAGAHRVSEIAGRLGFPASSLSRPLAALTEMGLVRRETPFGSEPRSGKRSLYRIDDPFLRLWFRVVAPVRTALAQAPRETRLEYWRRHRAGLEAQAWEELCRMAVPFLHRADCSLADLGPWEPAQRYWRRNEPEYDVVARSVDGRRPARRRGEVDAAAAAGNGLAVPAARPTRPGRRRPGGRSGGVRVAGEADAGGGRRCARGERAHGVRRAALTRQSPADHRAVQGWREPPSPAAAPRARTQRTGLERCCSRRSPSPGNPRGRRGATTEYPRAARWRRSAASPSSVSQVGAGPRAPGGHARRAAPRGG